VSTLDNSVGLGFDRGRPPNLHFLYRHIKASRPESVFLLCIHPQASSSTPSSLTPSFFHPKLLPPQASSTPSFSTSKLLHLQASSPYAISCLVSLMPTLSYNPSLPLSVVSCFFLKVIGTEVQFHRRGIKSLKRNLMLASCKA
jgi:hypothetical protein